MIYKWVLIFLLIGFIGAIFVRHLGYDPVVDALMFYWNGSHQ